MNLVILGPQGCGKGTQAKLLVEKYNLRHVDVGAALRNVSKSDTPLGQKVNEIINVKKELVPDAVITEVLESELANVSEASGVIIDGAPRRAGQIDEIEGALKKFGRKLDKVIFVNIPEKESVIRISKRYNCSQCGRQLILGKDVNNPYDPCHDCGGPTEQRPDDTPEGVRKRLQIFREETMPVLEYYRSKKMLIEVDGLQKPEQVLAGIVAQL
ncbi:nucleoside monophosphate kinase [Patescibacteria group bacterium]|nr:MAG: nucleoside monophosphate kinase [Patescibacteria group bacterium]